MSVAVIFGNDRFILDASGALYWPDQQLLVVADLHFEKGSSFAAAYRPLPPHDTTQTLANLAGIIETYQPKRVVCLGDSFHDRSAAARLSLADLAKLQLLATNRDWVWIIGNHDPVLPDIVGGTIAKVLTVDGITFQHDPAEGSYQRADYVSAGQESTDQRAQKIIFGHFHPVALVSLSGRLMRRRCFVMGPQRLLMPAFGTYAGGLNILHPAILDQFPSGYKIMLLERNKLYNVHAQHLRPDSNLAMSRKLPD
jgi:DNA ligase-associated metallophosphoesterase